MPWQSEALALGLEVDPATNLPAYREVRVSVPRRSGKTTLFLALQVDRCLGWGRHQRCLYSAQSRQDARNKWEEQVELLRESKLGGLFTTRRQTGLERTVWTPTGSTVAITATGDTSGHGFDLHLGMIDEAWAIPDSRLVQAFRPAMMSIPSAQLWVTSTMGTDESLWFNDLVDDGRARVEAGETSGVAYVEYSAADDDDPDDPETWARCMPALGHTVDLATIQADHDALDPAEFARAYLNRRAPGGRPVMDAAKWAACRDSTSQLRGLPCFAIDTTADRSASCIGVAGWAAVYTRSRSSSESNGRSVHVEVVDHRPGTEWVVDRLSELCQRWQPLPVVVDPASAAGSLLVDLAAAGIPTMTVSAREYAFACGQYYDAVADRALCHLEQPDLNAAVKSARKRQLGEAWAWSRNRTTDITPLVATTLALWGLVKTGQGNPQIL